MKTDTSGEIILCISTRGQGHALLHELARLGCRVVLLTVEELRDADWPHEILHEFHTMPGGMTQQQITNTVTYLARTLKFSRIIALDASDMKTAALLREHMRIPGMGLTTTHNFRDRLAMSGKAAHLGIRVPAFASIINYDVLRDYMENVPAPWLLKPRCVLSAVEAQTLYDPEQVWKTLEELGDDQSNFLLEQSIFGDIFSVDGITADGKVVFSAVRSNAQQAEDQSTSHHSQNDHELKAIHAASLPALGFVRGVTHTKFLRSHASGELYFLETAVGTSTAEGIEPVSGINLWVEWARVEVAAMRRENYVLPRLNK